MSFKPFNLSEVRNQFAALNQKVHGQDLVYLDSAATSLKPNVVVERITQFYRFESSNVHRGAHFLSDQATTHFEKARANIQKFIHAQSSEEIIFTKGTTESVNLVASTYGLQFLNEGDELVVSELEHHANLVPWQNLAQIKKLKLKFIEVNALGEITEAAINNAITAQTKFVAVSGCSNILGTITPIEFIIAKAHQVGAKVLVDAAQLITQKSINVQKLDVDFLAFSAHKIFGPFGFGVLYGKKELLTQMPPYQFGGSMISEVQFQKSSYNDLPFKFEAGTPHVEGAIGTDTAIEFFNQYAITDIFNHEHKLLQHATEELKKLEAFQIFGEAKNKAAILSFNLKGAHHSDLGHILNQQGVAVRVGHHCVQPLLRKFNLTGTVRASFSIYNSHEDVEKFVSAVQKAQRMLL